MREFGSILPHDGTLRVAALRVLSVAPYWMPEALSASPVGIFDVSSDQLSCVGEDRDGPLSKILIDAGKRAGDRNRSQARHVGYRYGEASHAEFLLVIVDGVAARSNSGKVLKEAIDVGDAVLGRRRHASTCNNASHLLIVQLSQHCFTDSRSVCVNSAAHFGEHAHG